MVFQEPFIKLPRPFNQEIDNNFKNYFNRIFTELGHDKEVLDHEVSIHEAHEMFLLLFRRGDLFKIALCYARDLLPALYYFLVYKKRNNE